MSGTMPTGDRLVLIEDTRELQCAAPIVIIITGLTPAVGESSGGFRRLIQIVFGLSIAFAASSFFLSFFQFDGGALV
jgi:type IV secretory pathway VirB2 component (pilin)